jgi:hypothetical protein
LYRHCFSTLLYTVPLVGSSTRGRLEIKRYSSGMVYADEINILGESVHNIKETEKL